MGRREESEECPCEVGRGRRGKGEGVENTLDATGEEKGVQVRSDTLHNIK